LKLDKIYFIYLNKKLELDKIYFILFEKFSFVIKKLKESLNKISVKNPTIANSSFENMI
jgi:hypothetical protein